MKTGEKSELQVIASPEEMRSWSRTMHAQRKRIALVPTMGFLHAGHETLLRVAREHADVVVMSLFVNPTQFGPKEDLGKYPRDLEGDLARAQAAGVSVVFAPTEPAMYPEGFQSFIEPGPLATGLCGARRQGHFRGVATVVAKLFAIVEPDMAIFGEKDYQQLLVIRRTAADLNLPVQILSHETVRETDGLAMSSRNSYLSPEERQRALALPRALQVAREQFAAGDIDVQRLIDLATKTLLPHTDGIDYLEIRDVVSLAPMGQIERPAMILGAAFFGKTRLIDNLKLNDED